jgi:hypothetical protein
MKYVILILLCFSVNAAGLRIRYSYDKEDGWLVKGLGSGVAINTNTILTCYHVVERGLIEVEIGKDWIEGKIVGFDKENDIALVKIEKSVKAIKIDESDITIEGSIKGKKIEKQKAIIKEGIIKYSADHGQSGAPVMCDGKLIGIIRAVEPGPKPTWATFVGLEPIRRLIKCEQ